MAPSEAAGIAMAGRPGPDLFSTSLISAYVDDPRFVPRPWLLDRVEDAWSRDDVRYVLMTGEPGSGKSALMAHLARVHAAYPRHFIRRDSTSPLQGADARTLLFSVGYQLAQLHPGVYDPERLELVVAVRAGRVAAGGQAVGIRVKDLQASPFFKASLRVTATSSVLEGDLVGISAGRMTLEPRLLELSNLQYLALLDPAQALAEQDPTARIVIFVDALDEIRWAATGEDILYWLTACPELPANVRIVLSSRPDEDKLRPLRRAKASQLVELAIDPESETDRDQIRWDVRTFLTGFVSEPAIAHTLSAHELNPSSFVSEATERCQGNFQYAVALTRGIDQALTATADAGDLTKLLHLQGIPSETSELYRFILGRIKAQAERAPIAVPVGPLDEPEQLPAWEALYHPILAVLAVAFEPLTADQLLVYTRAPAEGLPTALQNLGQFLDRSPDGRYRLYHATLPEFLTGKATSRADDPLHVSPAVWHALLAGRILRDTADWLGDASSYALAHAPAHLTEAIRLGDDGEGEDELWGALTSLLTDITFIAAKTQQLGIDALYDDFRNAITVVDARTPGLELLNLVSRALLQGRVALAREPDQLAGQLRARLLCHKADPAVDALIESLSVIAPDPWLRARTAAMGGRADLDTTLTFVGKTRALAFGMLEKTSTLAVGVDDRVELLDPLRGSSQRRAIDNDAARVTGLTLTELDGMPVLVVAAGYDSLLQLREVSTGLPVGPTLKPPGYVNSVALGSVDNRVVVAAAGNGQAWAWDAHTGDPVTTGADGLPGRLAGVTTIAGRLTFNVIGTRDGGSNPQLSVVDATSGVALWRGVTDGMAMEPQDTVAVAETGGHVLLAAWWNPALVGVWSAKTGQPFGAHVDLGDVPLQCTALGEVAGRPVIAASLDDEDTGIVLLREVSEASPAPAQAPLSNLDLPIHAFRADDEGRILALTGQVLTLCEVASEGRDVFGARDHHPDAPVIAGFLTGMQSSTDFWVGINDHVRLVSEMDLGAQNTDSREQFLRSDPVGWRATARCWGVVNGRAVLGIGSYAGAIWLWDIGSREVLAGPFADTPPELIVARPELKAARPPEVTGLALGHIGGEDVVASACAGAVQLWDVASGSGLDSPDMGDLFVATIGMGTVASRDVLVTGSRGGTVAIWNLATREPLTALTLDGGIEGVWVVRGADMVAALTTDQQLHMFDVVAGKKSAGPKANLQLHAT